MPVVASHHLSDSKCRQGHTHSALLCQVRYISVCAHICTQKTISAKTQHSSCLRDATIAQHHIGLTYVFQSEDLGSRVRLEQLESTETLNFQRIVHAAVHAPCVCQSCTCLSCVSVPTNYIYTSGVKHESVHPIIIAKSQRTSCVRCISLYCIVSDVPT